MFVLFCFFVFKRRFLRVALVVLNEKVGQASNSEIHLPLPPVFWDLRHVPPTPDLAHFLDTEKERVLWIVGRCLGRDSGGDDLTSPEPSSGELIC